MAWIQSHQSLARHPKMLRLASLAGINAAQAIGHLHYLWWWTLEYAPDGDLSRFDAHEIAVASEWLGDPNQWLAALRDCGWIDPDGHVHDWDDYAGKLAKDRARERERKRAEREKARKEGSQSPAPCPADVQTTSAGHPALDKTIQDKRREEVETERAGRAGPDRSNEPPAGFPKTEAEVVASAEEGVSGDFALKIWHLAASRGWRDAKGIGIRSWRSYLAASAAFAREAEARQTVPYRRERPRPVCRRTREIEEVIHAPIIQ